MNEHIGPVPPHDLRAERVLLGALIWNPTRFDDVRDTLDAEDFYRPKHRTIFSVMRQLYSEGRLRSQDTVTLHDALRAKGVTYDDIDAMTEPTPWSTELARVVVKLATQRRVLNAAMQIQADALAGALGPDELLEAAKEAVAAIPAPTTADQVWERLKTVEDFVESADATPKPWVIPGLLRKGWRCVIVAGEGSGKTVLMRSLAVAAAAGRHPLRDTAIEPIQALIIDLENPDDAIVETLGPLHRRAKEIERDYAYRAWIEARYEGTNLRSRTGRTDLERSIQEIRPDLVVMGPIYKMYRAGAGESDEHAAGDVMAVLDDLRARYGFALVLEHHAPKGSASGREILPHGTSLWLRWPELGLKLVRAETDGVWTIGRWREDRVKCAWPPQVKRGGPWLWRGIYPATWEQEGAA